MVIGGIALTRIVCNWRPQIATTDLVVEGFVLADPPVAHRNHFTDRLDDNQPRIQLHRHGILLGFGGGVVEIEAGSQGNRAAFWFELVEDLGG